MLKKILTTCAIFAVTFSNSFAAGRLYIAPAISYEDVKTKFHAKYQGFVPVLALGYGDMFYPWLYLAGELFGNYLSYDINNEPRDNISIKVKWTWGGSVILGYPLEENLMPYLRLGLVSTNFEKIDQTTSGYEIGIGAEVPINCNWAWRVEYDFIRYHKIHDIGEPENMYGTLGLVYRFG